MGLYKLPKQYHPYFKHPKQKPIGNVDVDWSNPLSNGLACLIPITEISGNAVYDLVNKRLVAVPSGVLSNKKLVFTTDNFTVDIPRLGNDTTLMYILEPGSTTANEYISDFSGGNELAIIQGYQDGNYNAYGGFYPIGGNPTNSQMPMSGGVDTLSYAVKGSNLTGVMNGVQTVDGTITTGDMIPTSPLKVGSANADSDYYSGAIYYIAIWNRGLSVSEQISIQRSPYQILKPKTPQVYFTPPAAAGIEITPNTVNTSWLSNNYDIDLTGEVLINPNSVNTSWAANNYNIVLSGEIEINPNSVNTNWSTNNYTIMLDAGIVVTPATVTTTWSANNYEVTLSGLIDITPNTVNTNWNVNNYDINLSQVVINGKSTRRVNAKVKRVRINSINKRSRINASNKSKRAK